MRFKHIFPFFRSCFGLLDLLCPPFCSICGEVIESNPEKSINMCPVCIKKMVTPDGHFCLRCGGRRSAVANNFANNPNECTRCKTSNFRFKRSIALGEYASDLRTLVLRLKTDITGILAISAARALVVYRRADLQHVQADYVVPVPMHPFRREDRGVNSPDLLAEELGLQLNIPVAKHFVRRMRPTNLQYTLSRQARGENVSDAFAVCTSNFWTINFWIKCWTKLGFRRFAPTLTGKNILLVDDIMTTGSTCNEITKVLLASGVQSVTVAVLARAAGENYRQSDG